jgi:thiopeptide-type bacteriocin biosynthesis protein
MRDQWISVHLYSDLSFEQVLANLIRNLVVKLTDMQLISSYFFIRYWEGGSHIRLRVLANDIKSISDVSSQIEETACSYYESQKDYKPYRLEFVPYEREVDRYAGEDGVKIAESIFEHSSRAVIDIINQHESRWNTGLAIGFAMKMHVILAKILFKDLTSIRGLFKCVFENWLMFSVKHDGDNQVFQANTEKVKKAFEKTFLEQKEKIVSIVKNTFLAEVGAAECENWEKEWIRHCQQVEMELSTKHLVPQDQIYQFFESHIHMTNNRLGVYVRDESFIAFMIYKVFTEIKIPN